jgi:hypothetical protein
MIPIVYSDASWLEACLPLALRLLRLAVRRSVCAGYLLARLYTVMYSCRRRGNLWPPSMGASNTTMKAICQFC